MAFVNYKNTNNASSLLISDITASATTILITDGDQNLFPSNFPFLLTLEHLDTNENVILREIVKVVSSNQNTFTVERSAGTCVQDDTATNRAQDNTAHAFYSGDRVSLYWTAEQVQDIQSNLELKANQDAIANVYDSSLTYSVGDIVVYNGDRYICSTAVETAEEFDPTKWTKVNVQYTLDDHQTQIDDINTTISQLGGIRKVDVLVLGGGGGGGGGGRGADGSSGNATGGGGGAGQLKIIEGVALKNNVFTVQVGNGGIGGTAGNQGGDGVQSKFGKIVAIGGGGGGGGGWSTTCYCILNGRKGGNGGGAGGTSYNRLSNPGIGGASTVGGHSGGIAYCWLCQCGQYAGGGGGGVAGDGGNGLNSRCPRQQSWHVGGRGIYTSFGGTVRCLGGGGTAPTEYGANYILFQYAANCSQQCISSLDNTFGGHHFGGGTGANLNTCNGCPNTGGGGGGGMKSGYTQKGGNGGSGLVIVRYPTDCSYGIKTATGGTITTATIDGIEYKVHTFTSSGTFEITESV